MLLVILIFAIPLILKVDADLIMRVGATNFALYICRRDKILRLLYLLYRLYPVFNGAETSANKP
jgi:hypothetical protein